MEAFDFDSLVQEIRDGAVVPIIGSELYARPDGSLYEAAVTELFARELGMEPLPAGATPRDVALAYQMKGGNPKNLKPALRKVIPKAIPTPPEPLVQLAQIRGIKLYVTTALDDLLEQALSNAGRPPQSFSHSPSATRSEMELPNTRLASVPSVCHVLGRFTGSSALTDANVLEFLGALLGVGRPQRLFEELAERNLLFLGCGFPDWLSRLFIRVIKDAPFTRGDARGQVIADARLASDTNLALFLRGHELMLYPQGQATDFVRELHRAWVAQQPAATDVGPPPAEAILPEGAVFLSFSSDDRDIVRSIARALNDAGVDVWFDERNIQPGDNWDEVIMANLRRAELFIPFVSQRTEAHREASKYFWKEWNFAGRHVDTYAPDAHFLLPVGLDRLDINTANVPPAFRTRQWFWLADRENTGDLITYIRKAYRSKQQSKHARRA
jgi:hypothetical protein